MNPWQEAVREFHRKVVEGPVSPAPPASRDADLRARLVLEEAVELAVALVGGPRALEMLRQRAEATRADVEAGRRLEPDLVAVVDGVCDSVWVGIGTAEAVGVDLDPYFELVRRANMAKTSGETGVPGKRGAKPPGWVSPEGAIAARLWWDARKLGAPPPLDVLCWRLGVRASDVVSFDARRRLVTLRGGQVADLLDVDPVEFAAAWAADAGRVGRDEAHP